MSRNLSPEIWRMLEDNYKKTKTFLSDEDARNIDLYITEQKRIAYKDGSTNAKLLTGTLIFIILLASFTPVSYFLIRQPTYPADCYVVECKTAEELCTYPEKVNWSAPDTSRVEYYWWPDGTTCTRFFGADTFMCQLD